LPVLSDWNRNGKTENAETLQYDFGVFGCSADHFPHKIPGSPVLTGENGWAVIDAVLYNREELIRVLSEQETEIDPHISDEGLLYSLVQRKGFQALAEVNGDFAGAVYNRKENSWTLFRDHLGVRPLYVYEDQNLYAFATEQRALLAIPGIDSKPDEKWLRKWFSGWNHLSATATFYQNIRLLPPAGRETVQRMPDGNFHRETESYWTLTVHKLPKYTDQQYIQKLRELITEAVSRRLDAFPGTVGVEMSGGLDSSVIGLLISRLGRQSEWVSWSMSPEVLPIQKRDERSVIFDLCRQENKECSFLDRNRLKTAKDMIAGWYPPFVNTLAISQTSEHLSRLGIRVAFSGQGGDEGVSHRANPLELWYQGERRAFLSELWEETKNTDFRLLRLIEDLARLFLKVYPGYFKPHRFSAADLSAFLKPDKMKWDKKETGAPDFRFGIDPIHYIQSGGERPRLENAAFQAAEYGVRYVFPYLDKDVLEYAVSLPRRLYLHHGINRYVFREAFKEIMPDALYRINYKDMPSLEGYKGREADSGEIAELLGKEQELLENSEFADILDLPEAFGFLKKFYLKKERSETDSEALKAAMLSNAMLCCSLAQQLRKRAKDGPRPVDK